WRSARGRDLSCADLTPGPYPARLGGAPGDVRRAVVHSGGKAGPSGQADTLRIRKGVPIISSSLPIILLGLVLGMRHATDPDHVTAAATIVSRQRSAWSAGLIGSLWGVGHTITITIVGGLIILFDVVIPPRVGLAMEFSVALMLILLGVLS